MSCGRNGRADRVASGWFRYYSIAAAYGPPVNDRTALIALGPACISNGVPSDASATLVYKNSSLFAMNGIFGRLQFITGSRRVLMDLCADLYDVSGFPRCEHAVMSLGVAEVKQAHLLSGRAIDAAETINEHQPSLWDDATYAVPVRLMSRMRARPKLGPVRASCDLQSPSTPWMVD